MKSVFMLYTVPMVSLLSTLLRALGMIGCLMVTAYAASTAGLNAEGPAKITPLPGSEYNLVSLTEKAAQRLGVAWEPVRAATDTDSITVPYASIIYGLHGETWAYVRTEGTELSFQRVPVVVERIEGNRAWLTQGPSVGAEVVVLGVAELYGADTGVGK